jgi:hypothetical protein
LTAIMPPIQTGLSKQRDDRVLADAATLGAAGLAACSQRRCFHLKE